MRKDTCDRITMENLLDNFIDALGRKLLQEIEKETLLDEELLHTSLANMISSLPLSDIKNKLTDNFEESFEKLKRFISNNIVPDSDWIFDIVNDDGLLGALINIEKTSHYEEKNVMYSELILCCIISCCDKLSRIFDHWNKNIDQATPTDILDTICNLSKFIPWSSNFKPLLHFLLHCVTSITNKDSHSSLLQTLRPILFRIITVVHYRDGYHGDILSQFIVLYIKLCILVQEEIPIAFVTTMLANKTDNSSGVILDMLLQLDINSNLSIFSPLLCAIIQMITSHYSSSVQKNPSCYIQVHSYISLLCNTEHFPILKSQFESFEPPDNLSQWAWSQSSRTCQLLGIKRKWTSQRLKKFLLQNISNDQFDLLLNLVKGDILSMAQNQFYEPVTTTADTSNIFYVDNQGNDKVQPFQLEIPKPDEHIKDTNDEMAEDNDQCDVTPFVTKTVSNTSYDKEDKLIGDNNNTTRKRKSSTAKIPQSEQKRSCTPTTATNRSTRLLRSTAKQRGIKL